MAKRKAVKKPVVKYKFITGEVIPTKKLKDKLLKFAKKKKAGPRLLLNDKQKEQLKKMHASQKYSQKELCAKFKISVPTLYNYLRR